MKFLLPIVLIVLFTDCFCQEKYDVFYLSVGSAHYERSETLVPEGKSGFANVSGARRSARYVHEILSGGGGHGSMLRSTLDHKLSKEDILGEVWQVLTSIKKTKSKNPFFIFYYCGHGVSEGIAWSQFLVPGNFVNKPNDLDSNPISIDLDQLSEELLYLGEVTDLISDAGLPYMCLIDACYEGKEESFSSLDQVLDQTSRKNFQDISMILRFMNEYHQERPVIWAAAPGQIAKVVPDPSFPEGVNIGPICRKMILINKQLSQLETLSVSDITYFLIDPEFDPKTPNIVSNYVFDESGLTPLLIHKND